MWQLRARKVVDEWQYVLLSVFVVIALVGGAGTYQAYADPGTERVEQTVSTWSMTNQYQHSATVQRENPIFPVGTVLQNRSVYYTTIAPVASIEPTVGYRAAQGSLDVELSTELIFRRVSTGEDGGTTVYWEQRRSLASQTVSGLGPGSSASVPITINASQVESRAAAVSQQLGGPGETRIFLVTQMDASGSVDGEPVDLARQYTARLQVSDGFYQITGGAASSESFERTTFVTRPRDPGPLTAIGGPIGLILGLIGLASVAVVGQRMPPAPGELAYLRFASEREDFEEWIHEVRLPESVRDRPRAEAESLSDLVDVAIDTDSAVHVERRGGVDVFLVPHDDLLYVYESPPIPSGRTDSVQADDGGGDQTGEESSPDADPSASMAED